MPEVEKGFAEINGAKLYYEVAGSGHPLVMVHAGIADNRMWDDQFNAFADQYRVIRFDQRGYGQSPPVDGEFSRHQDLYELLKFLNVDRAYLMGCSLGGGVSLNFALEYPDMAAALILVGSGPGGFDVKKDPPKQWDDIVKSFEANDLERTAELEVQVWVDGASRTPEQVDAALRAKVFDMNLIALKYEKLECGKELSLEPAAAVRLGDLRIPVLLVVGDLDTPYIQAANDFMLENLHFGQKVVMTGTAHVPNMEYPQVFNQHLSTFLASLS
ncbi:MAG: alpha/beta hydrolase [Anaerolineae bacterium]